MVLFVSCPTSSLESNNIPSSQDLYYELTTTTTSDFIGEYQKSQPIPMRKPFSCDDGHSTSPLERLPSPLATSAESVDSIMSSCSSRSSIEREIERSERRKLLDLSLGKLRGQSNIPLHKHLLVFNTVKAIQRDLDMLDDEDLYCSLVGMTNEAVVSGSDLNMEVDECCWSRKQQQGHHAGEIGVAPLKKEERVVDLVDNAPIDGGMEIDDVEMVNEGENETRTWSWTSGKSLFDSVPNESALSDSMYSFEMSDYSSQSANPESFGLFGFDPLWSGRNSSAGFDLWGSADPLAGSRFDLQHLFPSQLLLQA